MSYTSPAQYQAQVLADLGDRGTNAIFEFVFPAECTAGTWAVGLSGAVTDDLARFIPLPDLQTAFEALPTVGYGNTVWRLGTRGYTVEFIGAQSAQPMPLPSADGSSLEAAGEIAILVKQEGIEPVFHGDVSRQWNRFSGTADLNRRFLQTRYAANEEFLAVLQMQIDTKTGDVQRYYSQQFKNANDRHARFLRELENYVPAGAPVGLSPTATGVTPLVHTTPNGAPYGQFVPDGYGRLS